MSKCKPDDFYETDPALFALLDAIYHFKMDAAATERNTKVPSLYLSESEDALNVDWRERIVALDQSLKQDTTKITVFLNPPFSREANKDAFIQKAYMEAQKGVTTVMILPAKTDTASFHDYCYKKNNVQIEFLRGRPKFFLNDQPTKNTGRSPIMVVVFYNAKPSFIEEAKLLEYGKALYRALRDWKQKFPKKPRVKKGKLEIPDAPVTYSTTPGVE